jgi:hypothetical protein
MPGGLLFVSGGIAHASCFSISNGGNHLKGLRFLQALKDVQNLFLKSIKSNACKLVCPKLFLFKSL